MNHVVNNLWLGSQQDADALIRRNPEKITAILNVRGPDAYRPPGRDQSAEHPGKQYKWIAAPDTGMISAAHTKEALVWLQEQSDRCQRILIHCMHGISRSPAFLAAFMVKSEVSATLEEAHATIASHRAIQPAVQIAEVVPHVVLISALTGLPNRQAFDAADPAPFVACIEIDLMKIFIGVFGNIAADMLLRNLAKTLVEVGLDAYYCEGNEFLCKGESSEELNTKISKARRIFGKPFPLYVSGRIQTIEEADFSFAIAEDPRDLKAALQAARRDAPPNLYPEWRRKIIAASARGEEW